MTTQLVNPRLEVTAKTGWCLWHTQESFQVPHLFRSAWEAWEATEFKHRTQALPGLSVPVWFEHWGTYGTPPTYGNWGHVVVWVPGKGFLSAPRSGAGSEWLSSIREVERVFNSKFVGWSEDISGVKVIGEEDMKTTREEWDVIHQGFFQGDRPSKEILDHLEGMPDLGAGLRWLIEGGAWTGRTNSIRALASEPQDASDAEKKLQDIKDALNAVLETK